MITHAELSNAIAYLGSQRVMSNITDSTYAVPSLDYMLGDFQKWWSARMEIDGLQKWEDDNDCDNFAFRYYADAQFAHYKSEESTAQGLSVGIVFYMAGAREEDGSGGGHAINLIISGKENQRVLTFIEPQRAAYNRNPVLHLTPPELDSIWFINF